MNETGQLVLLADGDALVGIDLTDALETAGYRVLGPCMATADALALLAQATPDLAILDPQLRDGPCTAIAEALRRRGVPFLVQSAIPQDEGLADAFGDAPRLAKPTLVSDVLHMLGTLADARGGDAPEAGATAPPPEATRNPFLRKLEGFATLSADDRRGLEKVCAHPRRVPADTDLIRDGEAPEGVFLVLEGFACRNTIRASGARQITAYLVPGDSGDLDAGLLDAMDHTITTLSACAVVCIRPNTIARLMADHPQVARALRMSTLVDEATLREWVVNVGCRSAVERIAHLFCELFIRLQAVGLVSDGGFDLPITQVDLADTTGLSTVHVNRSLKYLRQQNLIELRSRRLRILNFPGLRAVAEFQATYLRVTQRAAA